MSEHFLNLFLFNMENLSSESNLQSSSSSSFTKVLKMVKVLFYCWHTHGNTKYDINRLSARAFFSKIWLCYAISQKRINKNTKFCLPFFRRFQALTRKFSLCPELQLFETTTVSCRIYPTLALKRLMKVLLNKVCRWVTLMSAITGRNSHNKHPETTSQHVMFRQHVGRGFWNKFLNFPLSKCYLNLE